MGDTLSAPFWCLCQKLSLSPLYFNKTLLHKSSERSSLVSGPRLNSSPLEAKNPGVLSFSNNLSSWGLVWDLQDKVRILGALVLCSPSEHVFRCTFLYGVLVWMNETLCAKQVRSPALRFRSDLIRLMAETCRGFILTYQCQQAPNVSFENWPEMRKECGPNSPFSVKLFGLFDHFITPWKPKVLT